jgi:alcohol dehydrogenase (NADP+)
MQMLQLLALFAFSKVFAAAQRSSPPTSPRGVQVDEIPILGLGTARLSVNTSEVIASAIENGYRHIDCAFVYGNQREIGKGIKEGLKRTGLNRTDLWITSKLGSNR